MILVSLMLALALAPPPSNGTPPAKAAWESCLQTFAQVESLGSKSDVTIAVGALAACSSDRDRYTKSLIREAGASPQTGQTAIERAQKQIAADQRDLTIRLLSFIRRARRT